MCRVEFSKIGKRDVTFIREMRVIPKSMFGVFRGPYESIPSAAVAQREHAHLMFPIQCTYMLLWTLHIEKGQHGRGGTPNCNVQ